MCTVTFIPRETGYHLAMNRDEQLARVAGLPPRHRFLNGRTIVCPSEPGGGTWISFNDCRVSFALINWYSVTARVKVGPVSRGEVVSKVSACCTSADAEESLAKLPLNSINPFRVIGIFSDTREVCEWKWNLKRLVRQNHEWNAQQWISSGYNEPVAQTVRSATFQKAYREGSSGSLEWLRRLHSSHLPERGPFSTCMHRAEAATVSYSEISVSEDEGAFRYRNGPPCMNSDWAISNLHFDRIISETGRVDQAVSTFRNHRYL